MAVWIAVRRYNFAPGIEKTTLADVEEYVRHELRQFPRDVERRAIGDHVESFSDCLRLSPRGDVFRPMSMWDRTSGAGMPHRHTGEHGRETDYSRWRTAGIPGVMVGAGGGR